MVLPDTGTPGTSIEINSEDNDVIHQLDNLNSFSAIAFELFSSMASALGL